MAPKRVTRKAAAAVRDQGGGEENHDAEVETLNGENMSDNSDDDKYDNADVNNATPEPGDKRKADYVTQDKPEQPAAAVINEPDTKKHKPDPPTSNRTISWLLSEEAFNLAFPTLPQGHGEIDWDPSIHRRKTPPAEDAGKHSSPPSSDRLLTYPDSLLTPFQNLVAALILSKPLSHRLGLRTINTLLNPPFGLRTVRDLDDAGFEGRRKVMWEARTQHKEKTASQLGDLVEGVKAVNGGDDNDEEEEEEESLQALAGLRRQLKGLDTKEAAQEKVRSVLIEGIKGIGPTGAGIFLRRVQALWGEVFPFADERALEAAREFRLVGDQGGVEGLAEELKGNREDFVRVLDVLVGIQLEKKMDEGVRMAGIRK